MSKGLAIAGGAVQYWKGMGLRPVIGFSFLNCLRFLPCCYFLMCTYTYRPHTHLHITCPPSPYSPPSPQLEVLFGDGNQGLDGEDDQAAGGGQQGEDDDDQQLVLGGVLLFLVATAMGCEAADVAGDEVVLADGPGMATQLSASPCRWRRNLNESLALHQRRLDGRQELGEPVQ